MTWGGLRGGISVALALSLPVGSERDLVLAMTYVLVVFSILVQGLTIKQVVMWFMRSLSIAGSIVEVPSPRLEGRFCAVNNGMDSLQFS